jgi:hypothetical protein
VDKIVGREKETAMLMRRWERARQGDGQLVLIARITRPSRWRRSIARR